MKFKSSRLMVGGLAAVTIMGLTAAVLPLSLGWVNDARQERDAVDRRLGSLKDVLELLVDAETGERGYVITGSDAFLQPYHAALSALPGQLATLHQHYATEPEQERRLQTELTAAAQRRLEGLSEIVRLRQQSGFAPAQELVVSGHGKAEMDHVRQMAGQLGAIERGELAGLNAALEKKIWWSIATSLGSTLLTLLLLGYLARTMVRAVRDGQAAAGRAQDTSVQLASGMRALERRNEEVSTLGEMSRLLQAEMSLAEALEVTGLYAGRLLPATSGSVYLMGASAELLERAGGWGPGDGSAETLEPQACWGLRRGQLHRQHRPGDLRCAHCVLPGAETPGATGHHTCVPLTAYGESMGLLHVYGAAATDEEAVRIGKITADMALAISEQISLALSNARLRQVLREQSIRDPLTGWYNRRYMEETLARELARAQRTQAPLSLLVADLDHFKKINDGHGHSAGDAVLRAATRQMAGLVRSSDVACRYGGEEFVIILPDCGRDAALSKAQNLCDSLRRLVVREAGKSIGVTASFGVASSPENGMDAAALFEAADAAVYQAKREGRDRVVSSGDAVASTDGAVGAEDADRPRLGD